MLIQTRRIMDPDQPRDNRIHPIEYPSWNGNILVSHHENYTFQVQWQTLREKLISLIFKRTWASTRLLNSVTEKQGGKPVFGREDLNDLEGTQSARSMQTYRVHLGQCHENHHYVLHIDPEVQTGKRFRGEKAYTRLNSSHRVTSDQSIHCKVYRIPGSGDKPAQFVTEPRIQKVHIRCPTSTTEALKDLGVKRLFSGVQTLVTEEVHLRSARWTGLEHEDPPKPESDMLLFQLQDFWSLSVS